MKTKEAGRGSLQSRCLGGPLRFVPEKRGGERSGRFAATWKRLRVGCDRLGTKIIRRGAVQDTASDSTMRSNSLRCPDGPPCGETFQATPFSLMSIRTMPDAGPYLRDMPGGPVDRETPRWEKDIPAPQI